MSAIWILVWPARDWGWRGLDQSKYKGVGRWVIHHLVSPPHQCLPSLSWFPEELSLSGLCQCLVELSTQPATVCYGSAITREAARGDAARRALQYLRIMAGSK